MEAGCHIFLIYLVYCFFRFDIPSISLDISCILFPMPISLSEKPGITITNALYLVFCAKNSFKLFFLAASHFHAASQEFVDTRMSHLSSLKFSCFGDVTIFQICYGICQSVDVGTSELV